MHRGMCVANNRYSHGTKQWTVITCYILILHTYILRMYIMVENTWMEAAYIAGTEIMLIVIFTKHSIVFCQVYIDAIM